VREEKREGELALMQEPALARVPRHFKRGKGGSHIDDIALGL
jgi:hypothetical protein